jgi:short subunit dehydrogenase-like uncharacterized protein
MLEPRLAAVLKETLADATQWCARSNTGTCRAGPIETLAGGTQSARAGLRSNPAGERRTARLETANGYRLTADGMIMAVKFLLEHAPVGGYYTPSMLMGARCVEQLPGSTAIRVD